MELFSKILSLTCCKKRISISFLSFSGNKFRFSSISFIKLEDVEVDADSATFLETITFLISPRNSPKCSSMVIFFFFLKGCGEGVDNGMVINVGPDGVDVVDGAEVSSKSSNSSNSDIKDCSFKLFSSDSDG